MGRDSSLNKGFEVGQCNEDVVEKLMCQEFCKSGKLVNKEIREGIEKGRYQSVQDFVDRCEDFYVYLK